MRQDSKCLIPAMIPIMILKFYIPTTVVITGVTES